MKVKLSGMRELAKLCPHAQNFLSLEIRSHEHHLLANIVDSILVQPEAPLFIVWALQQVLNVFTNVFGQFLEERQRLFIRQRAHLFACDGGSAP